MCNGTASVVQSQALILNFCKESSSLDSHTPHAKQKLDKPVTLPGGVAAQPGGLHRPTLRHVTFQQRACVSPSVAIRAGPRWKEEPAMLNSWPAPIDGVNGNSLGGVANGAGLPQD